MNPFRRSRRADAGSGSSRSTVNMKTFKQDDMKLYRCPCGFDRMMLVPNGNINGVKVFSAACAGCGDVVPGARGSRRRLQDFKTHWNEYMIMRQNQEGGHINDTHGDEEE